MQLSPHRHSHIFHFSDGWFCNESDFCPCWMHMSLSLPMRIVGLTPRPPAQLFVTHSTEKTGRAWDNK